jgi:hypothetical protein
MPIAGGDNWGASVPAMYHCVASISVRPASLGCDWMGCCSSAVRSGAESCNMRGGFI